VRCARFRTWRFFAQRGEALLKQVPNKNKHSSQLLCKKNGTKLIIDDIVSPTRARNPNTGELAVAYIYIPRMRFKFNLHRTSTPVVRTQFAVLVTPSNCCSRNFSP
jgi:hypothetical protein